MHLTKKLFSWMLTTLGFCSLTFSCSSKEEFRLDFNFGQTDIWENLSYEDVEVIEWTDGDTLTYKSANGQTNDLRITFIDTPETHTTDSGGQWVETQGLEYEWGIQAFEFAQNEISKGSTIRVVFESGESYDRKVGSVFYGENFSENYEVNIIQKGLALPSEFNLFLLSSPSNVSYYLAYPIAEALNYAYENEIGIYYEKSLYEEVYGVKGAFNFSDLLKVNQDEPENVYNWFNDDYWD